MRRVLLRVLPCILGLGSLALADIITLTTPTGATVGGLPVDVTATFITSENSVTIEVANLLANPTSIIQNLSDLGFALSSGETTGTLTSSSGRERTIDSDGNFTAGSIVSTGWKLDSGVVFPFGTGLHLVVLGTAIGPAHTVIGPAGSGGVYQDANGSIAGNGPHNPFLFGDAGTPVTFNLDVPGVTDDSTITGVNFSFGTAGANIDAVPEPDSLALVGIGAVLLLASRWLRGKRLATAVKL